MDAASSILVLETYVLETHKTSATLVFYGFYVLLFAIAIFTLHRRQTAGKTFLLAASWTLFLVGTVQTILCIMIAVLSVQIVSTLAVPPGSTTEISALLRKQDGLDSASEAIFVLNVFLTDLLFLCRCYLIYARQWRVILFPSFLIFLTSMAAIISLGTSSQSTPLGQKVHLVTAVAGYGIGLLGNIVLMALTASRLWWMSRASAHTYLHMTLKNRYSTTISIILESGAIYCICAGLLAVALLSSGNSGKFYRTMEGIAFQAVNIAPTLTVVRVGLGHNIVDSVGTGSSPGLALRGKTSPKVLECGGIQG
ncbi:hypothetical protein B0H16DRAFT_1534879 [Mycena metata]|uniref:Uncharacterized protein n=1 Tax=Mycena metata TaxID=1033252 RepID=A0AAD7NFV8_9AGAR|nr:hypothetical protein B0H16DRAFT_1534879 [Mycena metata]